MINTNPRYLALLENYLQYDRLTLILCAIAFLAVLGGIAFARAGGSKGDRIIRYAYYAFLIIIVSAALAGATIVLILGGSS